MDSKYKDSDKRSAKRIKAEFILTYRVNKPLEMQMRIGSNQVNAVMLDLSESGMAILTDFDIPISTILSIKFTLINLYAYEEERVSSIGLTGQVRNSIPTKQQGCRLGIVFTQINEKAKAAIANLVNKTIDR